MLASPHTAASGSEERLREALASRFGRCESLVALGRTGRSWLVDRGGERFVVKSFGSECSPSPYAQLFADLHQRGIAPRLRDVLTSIDGWYALFELVDGELPTADARWDVIWPQAVQQLKTLTLCNADSLVDLPMRWMARFDEFSWHDAPAELLRDRLRATLPTAPLVVAHGDFSPQNFVLTPTGLVLIDWEEAGRAPAGFDAGWVLALSQLGVSYGRTAQQLQTEFVHLGINEAVFRWARRLGLLRLLFRAGALGLPAYSRTALVTRLRELILDELNED